MTGTEEQKEHIEFQYIMNYKAYRRKMIMVRLLLTLVAAGGLACLGIIKMWLGIIFGTMALFVGALAIIVSLHKEETYIIFNTRFVIKHAEKRASVPLENIKAVRYKRAFYEKGLATGTITITATNPDNGKIKKYRMRHVFGAREGVKFLKDGINANASVKTEEKESSCEDNG